MTSLNKYYERIKAELEQREGDAFIDQDSGKPGTVHRTKDLRSPVNYTKQELDNLKEYEEGTSSTIPEDLTHYGRKVGTEEAIIQAMNNPIDSGERSTPKPVIPTVDEDDIPDLEESGDDLDKTIEETQGSVDVGDIDDLESARADRDQIRDSAKYDVEEADAVLANILKESGASPQKIKDVQKLANASSEDMAEIKKVSQLTGKPMQEVWEQSIQPALPQATEPTGARSPDSTEAPVDSTEAPLEEGDIPDLEYAVEGDIPDLPVEDSTINKVAGTFKRGAENVVGATGSVLQTLLDTAVGAGQGVTFGTGEDIAAGGLAAVDYLSGDKGDFSDLYKKRHEQTTDFIEESEERSPVLYKTAEIGGGILSGLLSGGSTAGLRAATVLGRAGQSLKVGATAGSLYGLGESKESFLGSNEDRKKVVEDIVFGGLSGAALGAGGDLVISGVGKIASPTIGRLGSYIADKSSKLNVWRAGRWSNEWGKRGLKPASASSGSETLEALSSNKILRDVHNEIIEDAAGLANNLKNVDKVFSDRVKNSLLKAEKIGAGEIPDPNTGELVKELAEFDIKKVLGKAISSTKIPKSKLLNESSEEYLLYNNFIDELENLSGRRPIYGDKGEILGNQYIDLIYTPEQVKNLMGELSRDYKKYSTVPRIQDTISDLTTELDGLLRKDVVGYDRSMTDMWHFRSILDMLKNKAAPEGLGRTRFANIAKNKREAAIFDGLDVNVLDKLTMGKQKTGEPIVTNMLNYLDSMSHDAEIMQALNTTKPIRQILYNPDIQVSRRLADGVRHTPTAASFAKRLYDTADKKHAMALLGSHVAINPMRATIPGAAAEHLVGFGPTAYLTKAANFWGRKSNTIKGNEYYKIGKSLFLQPDDELRVISGRLKNSSNTVVQSLGKKLEDSVTNNDRNGINSALFVLMQNKDARRTIGEE